MTNTTPDTAGHLHPLGSVHLPAVHVPTVHVPTVHIPNLPAIAKHAVPHLVEATVVPAVLFLVCLKLSGFTLAAIVALAWAYVALGRRVAAGKRIPGLLILSSVALTVRTVVAVASGSAFIYFLQPVVVGGVIGMIFLLSSLTRKPLVHRLAGDFCPLPPGVTERLRIRQLFLRLTLLWAAVNLINAALTLWLLLTLSTAVFVALRGAVGIALPAVAVVVTVAWSLHVAGQEGLRPQRRSTFTAAA